MDRKENGDRWWTKTFDQLNKFSYQDLFVSWITAVVLFAFVYSALSYVSGNGPAPLGVAFLERFLNALYYSVITATNTGYGDILPHGFSRFVAALESVAGLFIFAVFITKLMSRRQDIALHEVHKLTFENTFHNIREGLHTIRKDFDLVASRVRSARGIEKGDYDLLAVAYEQAASILNGIPAFYKAGGGFFTIDRRREDLLLEAVLRTFERIHDMLEIFSHTGVFWTKDEASTARLRELVRVARACVAEWRRRSPYKEQDAFEKIILATDRIESHLQQGFFEDARV